MPAKESTFVISLDFELHWGGFEKWPIALKGVKSGELKSNFLNQYFLNTREVIPKMLDLFQKYEVHVTWAAVGMLLHSNKAQLVANTPELKPTYLAKELSAYHYIQECGIGDSEDEDPFHFAPSLVKKILQTPNQELGTHSFSHFYCNELGQTLAQFRADLRAAKAVAAHYLVKHQSLVFPRNQFNDDYLKVCFEEGIKAVRSNPLDWFWSIKSTQKESVWKRLNRGVDAYVPIGRKNTYRLDEIPVRIGFPVCLPASRLLRPYRPAELFLNELKINRIKSELLHAARSGEVYHLWWHPHNFGKYPAQSLEDLERILKHFSYCRDNFNMQSLNMGETAELLANNNGNTKTA